MPIRRRLTGLPLLAIVAITALIALGVPGRAHGIGFGIALTVDTTADTQAADGYCSLREAIIATNNNTNDFECHASGSTGPDGIFFNIPPGGVQTITPTSALPPITGALTIDASGQPAGADNCGVGKMPCIRLDGSSAGGAVAGLTISVSGVTVRGLAIDKWGGQNGTGINVTTGSTDTIAGDFIGTADGTTAGANQLGIWLKPGVTGVTIGGTSATDRNLISGNSNEAIQIDGDGNVVEGNYIGTTAAGDAALANHYGIFSTGSNNTIGGTDAGAGNVVSGNSADGIKLQDAGGTHVLGNLIGTDATGAAAIPNTFVGVRLEGATDNFIGGPDTASRNVISGNGYAGIANGSYEPNSGNQIEGNFIGLNAAGTDAVPNDDYGISLLAQYSGDDQTNNTITGNVISGNSHPIDLTANGANVTDNKIFGNVIGLNAAGAQLVPNGGDGVYVLSIYGAATGNQIGGTGPGQPNVLSGNASGVNLGGPKTSGNFVTGNLIGTDPSGTQPLGNRADGVAIQSGAHDNGVERNTIAASAAGEGGDGVWISDAASNGNRVLLNYIGTNASGDSGLGNAGDGVHIVDGAQHNEVGSEVAPASANDAQSMSAGAGGNAIMNNGGAGVHIDGATTLDNRVSANSIDNNGGLGIKLDAGANGGIATPVLTSATSGSTHVQGTLAGPPNQPFLIEFFASPHCDPSGSGEGRTYLGSVPVNTGPGGQVAIDATLSPDTPPGGGVTATATDDGGNTSQFSNCVTAAGPTPTPSPTPTGTPSATRKQGDVNCDGVVDILDFEFLMEFAAGLSDGTTPGSCPDLNGPFAAVIGAHPWGDVNCDNAVNALDALYVLAHMAGIELPHAGCTAVGAVLT